MKSKSFPVSHMGASLILCVFIILSLVTFAALSAVNTQRDRAFGEKISERTAAYYAASNQAEDLLSQIDDILYQAYQTDSASYYEAVKSALAGFDGIETDFSGALPAVSFQISFGEDRALAVCLELTFPTEPGDRFYRITSWKERSTREWEGENIVPVLSLEGAAL